jgi:hypothetical protein
MRRHKSIAKVAMGRRLAVRLYWMWRNGSDYSQARAMTALQVEREDKLMRMNRWDFRAAVNLRIWRGMSLRDIGLRLVNCLDNLPHY